MHIYEFLAVLSVRKPLVTYNLSNVHDFKLKVDIQLLSHTCHISIHCSSDMWLVAAILVETDAGAAAWQLCSTGAAQAAEGEYPRPEVKGDPSKTIGAERRHQEADRQPLITENSPSN